VSESIFGPIFDGSILTDATIATLRKWMPTILRELQLTRGMDKAIPLPRTYTSRNEFSNFADDQLPLVVVISPGLASEPRADGEGRYSGWWGLGVGVIASAAGEQNSDRMAKLYGAAVRKVLLNRQTLDDSWEFSGIEYVDEVYDDLPDPDQERSLRAARLVFRVEVQSISTRFAGPAFPTEPDPGTQPGSNWPTVDEADVTVNVVEEV
jgi:hypothetical protein